MRRLFFTLAIAVSAALPAQDLSTKPLLEEWKTMTGHKALVRCLAFALDGTLASGGRDRSIRFWAKNGDPIRTVDLWPVGG